MAILAYDDVWLREPNLLLPNGRPVGTVKPSLPGAVAIATLFRGRSSNGLPGSIVSDEAGTWSPNGYTVASVNDSLTCTLANKPGSGSWTFLLDVTNSLLGTYDYMAGGDYSTGFGFTYRHQNLAFTWGFLYGSTVVAPTGAAILNTGRNRFGFSRLNATTVACALDGRSYGTVAISGSLALTEFAFNTYDPGQAFGFGGTYHAAILVGCATEQGRLAELTGDTSLWWVPA